MIKISTAEALRLAEEHYPTAPEELVKLLEIDLRFSPLNCDGWCLQLGEHSIIRINEESPEGRRRFTLAHELGHLLLGFPTIIGESVTELQNSVNEEEKLVNAVAEKLLLPKSKVQQAITEIPVTAQAIRKLAKKARVSELFVARRLAKLAKVLGLKGALVIYYRGSKFQWQWSKTLEITSAFAARILKLCEEAHPNPARLQRKKENDVIVGSILENPTQDSTTILLQLVHEEDGLKKLSDERRRELEQYVFAGDDEFRMSLTGCFGAFKSKIKGMTLEQALRLFKGKHLKTDVRWGREAYARLTSAKGQEYVKLRLKNLLN